MKAANDDKICKYFNCPNSYYYNYDQDDCINTIPAGFYCNDTNLKTIDKCNKVCKTCNQGSTITKANCLTCNDDYPYFFFGNCLDSCENGYKNNSGFLECNCSTVECSDCTEDSLNKGLCKECNEGYYQKEDDISYPNNYIKCYKDPPGYYLDDINQIYKPCYSSCKKCYGEGNDEFHNCEICDSKHTFALIKNISGH
jgi:hypothetical protein